MQPDVIGPLSAMGKQGISVYKPGYSQVGGAASAGSVQETPLADHNLTNM
jgi:hypothetical protein